MANRSLKQVIKSGIKETLRPVLQRYPAPSPPLPPSCWGLVSAPGGGLRLHGVDLDELLREWGSPLHVVDAARLRLNAQRFLATPRDAAQGAEVYYSYKSNPIPGVLSFLHEQGIGAEVISEYELWLARRLGVPPQRIVYNGPAKSNESLRAAIQSSILLLNFNHREEIERVAAVARSLGRRVRVGVRVSAGSGWSAQFGVPIADGEALTAYAEAKQHGLFDVVGLHAHRGGMIHDAAELDAFVGQVLAFSDTLRTSLGIELELLDLGGSLGTPTVEHIGATSRRLSQTFYRDPSVPPAEQRLDIDAYVARLVSSVEAHYRQRSKPRPRVLLEPGRAMTGNAQFLLASVIETKRADGKTYAIIDAGINLAESARNEYHQLLPVSKHGAACALTYTVVGPICTPGDTLYPAIRLPELCPGDSLAIMDAGAYFVPFSTSFSFPRPAVVMVDDDGEVRRLRRAERHEDLIALDEEENPLRAVRAGS